MQTYKTVIVDDETNSVELLDHFLTRYCPQLTVVGTANTKQQAIDVINRTKPDILFLDIKLDVGLSFDIIDKLVHDTSKIIFVTAYDEYAIRAFKYSAVDYLLKPLNIDELKEAVVKACQGIDAQQFTDKQQIDLLQKTLNKTDFNFVAVPNHKQIDLVKIEDIIVLKSDGRYTTLCLSNGNEVVASKNIGEYESSLNPSIFFRIHRSYLINLNYVSSIYKGDGFYCVMQNGEKIPVAKRRIEKLLKFVSP